MFFLCAEADRCVPRRHPSVILVFSSSPLRLQPTLLCSLGSFCAGGNEAPVPCSAGSYANVTGLAACLTCPATRFCPAGSIQPLACPAGYACPGGSVTGLELPCPAGTFSAVGSLRSVSQCTPCSAGMWCGSPGLTAPSGPCDAGFYCSGGSAVSAPALGFSPGYVCSAVQGYGTSCPVYFDAVSGQSYGSSRYTATAAAASPVGDVCPKGSYCVAGSASPAACPAGTFANTTGTTSAAGCLPCPPGLICPTSGIVIPTTRCPPGQYCPGGANTSGTACPPGSRCTGGNTAPEPCSAGTYQNASNGTACRTCPAAYFCGVGTVSPALCPPAYACPAGSSLGTPVACPVGTYSNASGLSASSQCTRCSPGMYCAAPALVAPSGNCSAGYVCVSNATSATPTDGRTGSICARGGFCPAGSSAPTLCRPGTFGNATGRTSSSDCLACTPGFTCPTAGLVVPTLRCDAGYLCPGGDATATVRCPLGE